jgi:serine/threonine protein kinase
MSHETQIMGLLQRWQDMRKVGISLSPQELCRDCPELLQVVRQRLGHLQDLERLMDAPTLVPLVERPDKALLEGYVIERLLGEGGMGKVYLVANQAGTYYAVKKARMRDAESRRIFRTELQTWIGLPEHPHIAVCYFFRMIGDETAIFGEYLDGGSLLDWIRQRRLKSIDQILDVAIQFAWGLYAAHECGLVHQDVKPGNVLMTGAGVAKVADFGLARTRAVLRQNEGHGRSELLVTNAGMTPAYCSPEQATHQRLSHHTDMWSWAASVLEMFIGEIAWRNGLEAPGVLERYLATGGADACVATIPLGVAEVLRKCFCHNPNDRWPTMAALTAPLIEVYRELKGADYPRPGPCDAEWKVPVHSATYQRMAWDNPRAWLWKALALAEVDLSEAKRLLVPPPASEKAQVVADLGMYEEIYHLWWNQIANGQNSFELAQICMNKALIHTYCGDYPGASGLIDEARRIYEHLVQRGGRKDLIGCIQASYKAKSALFDRVLYSKFTQEMQVPSFKAAMAARLKAILLPAYESYVQSDLERERVANRKLAAQLLLLSGLLLTGWLVLGIDVNKSTKDKNRHRDYIQVVRQDHGPEIDSRGEIRQSQESQTDQIRFETRDWASETKEVMIQMMRWSMGLGGGVAVLCYAVFLFITNRAKASGTNPGKAEQADTAPPNQQQSGDGGEDQLKVAEALYLKENWEEARVVFERVLSDAKYKQNSEYVRHCLESLRKKIGN